MLPLLRRPASDATAQLHAARERATNETIASDACVSRMDNRCVARPALRSAAPAPFRRRRPIGLAPLRGFESAARHLSFTLAAQELHLTQSSISRQVATLERQVGKKLFKRGSRALELTAAGRQLYNAAQHALADIDHAVERVRCTEAPPRVTVATYASFASLWLVPRLPAFQAAHPGIDIRIDAADRLVDLQADEIDVALRRMSRRAGIGGEAVLVIDEEINAAVSPRLLETLRAPLTAPADLDRLTLLELDDVAPGAAESGWAAWCAHAGITPLRGAARLSFTYFDQAMQAAVRGQGAVMARTPFLDDFLASGDLVTPFPALRAPGGCRYCVVANPRRSGAGPVRAFIEFLLEEFRRGPHPL
jgi:DNA-binding transcriptional LysR family regulator